MTHTQDPEHEQERRGFDLAIENLANALNTMPQGQKAELRRLSPDDPASPIFFRIV